MFDVKQFKTGEYDVVLTERLSGNEVLVEWNYFKDKDVMLPILKADAIRRQYGDKRISLVANYLPYQRADRMFTVGGCVGAKAIVDLLLTKFDSIRTMAIHHQDYGSLFSDNRIHSSLISCGNKIFSGKSLMFPDKSAKNHLLGSEYMKNVSYFEKVRKLGGVAVGLVGKLINDNNPIIIVDDICDGGRTFVEVAKLINTYFDKPKIELLVYNAFLDFGIDALKESGITKVYIVNPDSYEYVTAKYGEEFFSLVKNNTLKELE